MTRITSIFSRFTTSSRSGLAPSSLYHDPPSTTRPPCATAIQPHSPRPPSSSFAMRRFTRSAMEVRQCLNLHLTRSFKAPQFRIIHTRLKAVERDQRGQNHLLRVLQGEGRNGRRYGREMTVLRHHARSHAPGDRNVAAVDVEIQIHQRLPVAHLE